MFCKCSQSRETMKYGKEFERQKKMSTSEQEVLREDSSLFGVWMLKEEK